MARNIKAGNFEINVYDDGSPSITIYHRGTKVMFNSLNHIELQDLEYCLKHAKATIKQYLPDKYKGEII